MEKCPITDLPTEEVPNNVLGYSYKIKIEDDYVFITLGFTFQYFSKDEYFINNRYLLAGAILNNQMSERKDLKTFSLTESDWKEKISKVIYPKTPKDKLDNLFKSLYNLQKYDGEKVQILKLVSSPEFWSKLFFKSRKECYYYFMTLDHLGLIKGIFQEITNLPVEYQITFSGLNYYLDLTEFGKLSNKCFVAMSFGKDMTSIRSAIRESLNETGYDPIVIDEQHIDSDKTINDAIIAGLKGAKFCIADFTEQKYGVYFESGFALGQGKPIIYCCRRDHFNESHFDTKHFSHIIYDTPDELKMRLVDKINAWIK